MKVYIVTRGSYSDYCICEVFTNKEQAELYLAVHELDDGDIEEYEADTVHYETDEKPKKHWSKYFSLDSACNGAICDCGLTMKEKRRVEFGRNYYHAHITTEKDCDAEKADKIMNDFIAEWKYNYFIEQANKAKGE